MGFFIEVLYMNKYPKHDDKNDSENPSLEEVEAFTWTHGAKDVGILFLFCMIF
jgi:hypothetical protein